MKKKLVSWLLVLCTVLAALPLMASTASAAEAADYESMYVQDGLQVLLTAFDPTNSTVDLEGGKWTSKKGSVVATLGGPWKVAGDAGIRFDLAQLDTTAGITLPISALPKEDYTIETVGRAIGVTQNGDGVTPFLVTNLYPAQVTAFIFGPMKGEGFPTQRDPAYEKYTYQAMVKQADGTYQQVQKTVTEADILNKAQYVKEVKDGVEVMAPVSSAYYYNTGNEYSYNQLRFYYCEGKMGWAECGSKYGFGVGFNDISWRDSGSALSWTMTHTLSKAEDGSYSSSYAVTKDLTGAGGVQLPKNNFKTYHPVADDQEFAFFRSFPAIVYAIRVYNRVLTLAEQQQNHFVDILAYHKIDPSVVEGKSASELATLYEAFSSMSVDAEKETVDALLKAAASSGGSLAEDTLYVTEGLKILLTTFGDGKDTITKLSGFSLWKNQVDGSNKTLKGDVWQVQDNGSVGYRQTLAQWNGGRDNGLVLAFSDLPNGSWTVETVVNPVGLTNEDGSRYVDDVTVYGTYLDYGFCFGPLKAMTFVCMRPAGKDGQMEHRWVYQKSGCWQASGFSAAIMDTSWKDTDGKKAVTFTVTHDYTNEGGNSSTYKIWDNFYSAGSKVFDGLYWMAQDSADNMFQLMYGQPGDMYAVRVYDRVLSETEMLQNHVADLVYFYDLDPSMLQQALTFADHPYNVYKQFRDMSFDLSKAEANKVFEAALGGMWISADGVAVRQDSAGIRAEFTLNQEVIAGMEAAGYKFELGVLVNLESVGAPTLEKNDYRLCAYKDGAKNETLFIDEDSFAAAILYSYATTEMYMEDYAFAGYLILTKPDGGEVVIMIDVTSGNYGMSAFSMYTYMQTQQDYATDAFINSLVNSCYEKKEIFVAVDGDDTAAGTEGAPLKTLAQAIVQLTKILGESTAPTDVKINLGEGVYRMTDTVVLNKEQITLPYYRINIDGGDAAATTVTSNMELDGSAFVKDDVTGLYVYQFEADAEGKYPEFRFLYVDGKIATMAYNGATRNFTDEKIYKTPVEKGMDLLTGMDNAGNKFYLHKELFVNCRAEDYAQLEVHLESQWNFNIMHVTEVDMNDSHVLENGEEVVAVYFNPNERAMYNLPGGYSLIGRQYWLQNSVAFVDKPGEYHYDLNSGKLYYMPEEGTTPADYTFEYPTLDNLLAFRGVNQLTIQNITFTGADDYYLSKWGHQGGQAGTQALQKDAISYGYGYSFPDRAAIYVDGISGMKLEYCVFDNLGCEGATMRGRLDNVTVEGCQFFDIGATALRMADGLADWNEAHGLLNTYIYDNYFNNLAFSIRQCNAVQFGSCKDFVMEYNTITNCSYTAISIGWRWQSVSWQRGEAVNLDNVRISENYITDFMTDMKDGGAIYTLGGNATPDHTEYFNYLNNNLVVFSEKTGCGGMVNGLYHDGSSSNWHDTSNVVVEASTKNIESSDKHKHYYYIYIQHIDGQETHNVLQDSNFIVNVRNTEPEKQITEVYRNYLTVKDAGTVRNIKERATVYILNDDLSSLDGHDVANIIYGVGSSYCPPEIDPIIGDAY